MKSYIERNIEKPSRLNAINAKCMECMGGDNTRQNRILIDECTASDCPLYGFRPRVKKHDDV